MRSKRFVKSRIQRKRPFAWWVYVDVVIKDHPHAREYMETISMRRRTATGARRLERDLKWILR